MAFDFTQYENFARQLAAGPNEVEFRNSVSRGYYAFYHKLRAFYGRRDADYNGHDDFFKEVLSDTRIRHRAPLSNFLKNAFMKRVEADYKRVPIDKSNGRAMDFNLATCRHFWLQYDLHATLLNSESLDEEEL